MCISSAIWVWTKVLDRPCPAQYGAARATMRPDLDLKASSVGNRAPPHGGGASGRFFSRERRRRRRIQGRAADHQEEMRNGVRRSSKPVRNIGELSEQRDARRCSPSVAVRSTSTHCRWGLGWRTFIPSASIWAAPQPMWQWLPRRLGRKAAIITGVGDDPFGRYVRRALVELNVDDRYVVTNTEYATPVTFCEIFPPDNFRSGSTANPQPQTCRSNRRTSTLMRYALHD